MPSTIIKIKDEIKAALDARKRPGQTYSGVIQELLNKTGDKVEK